MTTTGGTAPRYSRVVEEVAAAHGATETTIDRAGPPDEVAIRSLLAAAGLPLDGLEVALATALVARDGARIAGCAALERYGAVALLRSVCVGPEWRGHGLGSRLVEAALDLARDEEIRELYLLTETAAAWFPRFGFEPVTRDAVPDALRATAEFAGACPVSAAVLRRAV